jgi:hypothetical protein
MYVFACGVDVCVYVRVFVHLCARMCVCVCTCVWGGVEVFASVIVWL